ncbi:MAG: cell division protein ZapA [Alphaproteobacteria bacterium]|nr:cell division protein ZapA [Alphaproteobacteria bacterium]
MTAVPSVSLSVNGRSYTVACGAGEEERLQRLAGYIDQKATKLAADLGQIGEARLMLLAGLLVADELASAFEEIARLKKTADGQSGAADALGRELDLVAQRVEAIAARLEQA